MSYLPVNSIYPTIQGEGTYTGTPSFFVRLQGCPVGCQWCDERPTWELNPAYQLAHLREVMQGTPHWCNATSEEIIREALKHKGIGHVVITGGEPCIHDLQPLVDTFREKGYSVQIETSCTFPVPIGAWITASPKVDMPGGYKVIPEVVREAHEIKYPVGKAAHVERLRELLTLWRIPPEKPIFLQPLSQSIKATRACIQACLDYGFRLSVQTHKYLEID